MILESIKIIFSNIKRIFLALRHFLKLSCRRSMNHIVQKIPQEILNVIFVQLSIPDQICFFLSFKYLCMLSVIPQITEHQVSGLVPPEERLRLGPNAKKRPRNHLLLHLQNDRWRFCKNCWILHARLNLWGHLRLGSY